MSSLLVDIAEDEDILSGALDELSPRRLAERLQELERLRRRCEAAMIAVLDQVDRADAYREDGHLSIRGWAGATVRWSDTEIRDRLRTVTLVRDVPDVAAELTAGRLGVAQVHELARLRANPRIGERLGDDAAELIAHAENLPFNDFRTVARRWESLNDADGAHNDHKAAHEGRRVSTSQLDTTFHLAAQFGVAQGTAIADILQHFEDAEFQAEWDKLRAEHGDDATPSMLERSHAQRRADAMYAIFMRAASMPVDAQAPEPVVNIVVDQTTFEEHLARLTGSDPITDGDDPIPYSRRRCETIDGTLVDVDDIVAASVIGHVRRVVMNSAGVVINMGRKQRLFVGSARVAAMLQGRRCSWPGCGRHRCQLDHSTEWHDEGITDPVNAGPKCPPHNRFKTRGYRVVRDEHGRWHTYRPDGTEITAT